MTGLCALADSLSPVPPGRWGGAQVNLIAGESFSSIDLGCGAGVIDGPLKVDANGRFKAGGRMEVFRPGPQRTDVPPAFQDAVFEGQIRGDTMDLTVQVTGGSEPGKFQLKQNRVAKIIRCL